MIPSSKPPPARWPPRSPLRVLLVLDQLAVAEIIRLTLTHGPFVTQWAADLAAGVAALDVWAPHLILLDMDVVNGAFLAQLGAANDGGTRLPVIGLTRRGDLRAKLAAFEQGVDDVLTVPFSPEELLARVIAVARRSYQDAVTFTPTITVGDLEIDILHRTVRAGDHALHLTSIEQSLLYLLAANAGRVLTRDEILDTLWGTDYVAESNVVDRQVRNLRARLQNDWRKPRFIATVPGQGYRFVPTYAVSA
jgi:DNA-binding response OmpR family regulator